MRGGGPAGESGVMDMRCMIIDDNVAFLHALRSMLERGGASVVGFASSNVFCATVQPAEE